MAFSVAEAMITLLIVSVALAAMAPIFSKKAVSDAGNSKWLFTRNGSDITRTSGNVGIGVPVLFNPEAKFEIRGSNGVVIKIKAPNTQSDSILDIRKGNRQIAYMDSEGAMYLLEPIVMRNSSNRTGWNPLTTYEGNDWRNALLRDGGLIVNTTENRRIFSGQVQGVEKAWINSDGSSSFSGAPKGMVAFFDGGQMSPQNQCPPGWVNLVDVASGWGGRFFRVASKDNIGAWQADSIRYHTHPLHFDGYAWGAKERSTNFGALTHTFSAGTMHLAGSVDFESQMGGSDWETRPYNVAMLTCRKE